MRMEQVYGSTHIHYLKSLLSVHINQVVKWELNLCLLNQAILVYSTSRSRISLQIDCQNTSKDRRRHRGILPVWNLQRLSEGN